MANLFQLGESVICSITVRDSSGDLQDPYTSMKIVINRLTPSYANVVASTSMTGGVGSDGVGLYHYDCQTSGFVSGDYEVFYTATDSARITVHRDTFILERGS